MNLEEIIVGEIKGNFKIEAYQRGYRWSQEEIVHLLNDVVEIPDGQKYCLQPIVVKKTNENYELIDGQQRLTTLYLIMKYLKNLIDINYSIEYTTRKSENGHIGSKELLETIDSIDLDASSSNIDELFFKNAYKTIREWFNGDKKTEKKIAGRLEEYVSVIWYEVDNTEDSTNIFTRLNIGKINLTNAELVKALFLSRGKKDEKNGYTGYLPGIDNQKQHEIALQWDQMEKELHDDKFWSFITNENASKYPIRMELLFDIIEMKPKSECNFYTFNKFYNKFKECENKYSTWETIVRDYQQLREWFEDFNLFHQIGFLVTYGESIKELLDIAMSEDAPLTKSQFKQLVVGKICEKMIFKINEGTPQEEDVDYTELNYENHPQFIHTLLLLFNVETIRQKGDENMRFPFDRYKTQGNWSLEHIHAQNSESLKTNKDWLYWLVSHKKSMDNLLNEATTENAIKQRINDVISKLDKVVSHINDYSYKGSIRDEFNSVSTLVMSIFSAGDDNSQIHSLSNMALLTVGENAALNNSAFDVKREEVIKLDKNGDYIPVCTRNVFLKYYSNSDTKMHFWSVEDRKSYINAINDILYKPANIAGKEVRLIKSEIRYGNR